MTWYLMRGMEEQPIVDIRQHGFEGGRDEKMQQRNNKRIGIFEYDWSMYHYVKDFAIKFTEAGYWVDIFLKDWNITPDFANTSDLTLNKNIRFFNFTTQETRRQAIKRKYTRLLNKIAIPLSIPRNDTPEEIIARNVLERSKEIIGTSQYDCFIGIEKKGLVWAGILSEMYHCPLIYFSLELYIEDNPALHRFYHLLAAEKKYHKLAVATIIQDKPRANVLLRSNGIEQTNLLYFPVSAKGNAIREKSQFLQNKLHIDNSKRIILHFGAIDNNRFLPEIVSMAKDLDDGVILVIHGFGRKAYVDYLQSIADKNKVIFSLDFIAEEEIENLISSADIGIALYATTNANDRLVAFSSSKVAYYTQCGVPMIAFDTESSRELVSSYRCAELINTTNEIPLKVRKIFENYDLYREQSYAAYQRFYNLDENFSRLLDNLGRSINGM
jgi:glycosyltransferase involved in cell wall biosynthesis